MGNMEQWGLDEGEACSAPAQPEMVSTHARSRTFSRLDIMMWLLDWEVQGIMHLDGTDWDEAACKLCWRSLEGMSPRSNAL